MIAWVGGSSAVTQQGWLLHSRRFRENSVIATMLTLTSGKISGVIHASRGRTQSAADNLQAFQPYIFSQSGRSELKRFSSLDFAGHGFSLSGRATLVGLYFNELLYRLLPEDERVADIHDLYTSSLCRLHEVACESTGTTMLVVAFSARDPLLWLMREFELSLTTQLGLHPGFQSDAVGRVIRSEIRYVFVHGTGWLPESQARSEPDHLKSMTATGRLLMAVEMADWQIPGALGLARQLATSVIDKSLDGRTLNTRQLIQRAARPDTIAVRRGLQGREQSDPSTEDLESHDH